MTESSGASPADRWERRAEWPLMAAALIFLLAYAWPILDLGLSPEVVRLCVVASWVAWTSFALDYVVRLALSPRRGTFVRRNLLDLTVIILPILRPLRLLRLVTLLSVLNRTASIAFRGRLIVYVAGATSLLVLVSGLAILDAERRAPEATITTYGDAVWWAVTTMTTVGYGDHYPVTGTGRLVAFGLMLAGIALLGVVTATFASWIVQRINENEQTQQAATQESVQELTTQIQVLQAQLHAAALRADGNGQRAATDSKRR